MITKINPKKEILDWILLQIQKGLTEMSDEDIAQATGYSTQTVFKSVKTWAMQDKLDVVRCCGRKSVYRIGRNA